MEFTSTRTHTQYGYTQESNAAPLAASAAFFQVLTSWSGALTFLMATWKGGRLAAEVARLAGSRLEGSIGEVAKAIQESWAVLNILNIGGSLRGAAEATKETVDLAYNRSKANDFLAKIEKIGEKALNSAAGILYTSITILRWTGTFAVEYIPTLRVVADAADAAASLASAVRGIEEVKELNSLGEVQAANVEEDLGSVESNLCLSETSRLKMLSVAKNLCAFSVFFFRAAAAASGVGIVPEIALLSLSFGGTLLSLSGAMYKFMMTHKPVELKVSPA